MKFTALKVGDVFTVTSGTTCPFCGCEYREGDSHSAWDGCRVTFTVTEVPRLDVLEGVATIPIAQRPKP